MSTNQREAVLQDLHDRHARELWRFALRLTRDPHVAEDVVQEAMLRAWRDPQLELRNDHQARAWLFTVVRNLVVDRWRSAAHRHEVGGRSTSTAARATAPARCSTGGSSPMRCVGHRSTAASSRRRTTRGGRWPRSRPSSGCRRGP